MSLSLPTFIQIPVHRHFLRHSHASQQAHRFSSPSLTILNDRIDPVTNTISRVVAIISRVVTTIMVTYIFLCAYILTIIPGPFLSQSFFVTVRVLIYSYCHFSFSTTVFLRRISHIRFRNLLTHHSSTTTLLSALTFTQILAHSHLPCYSRTSQQPRRFDHASSSNPILSNCILLSLLLSLLFLFSLPIFTNAVVTTCTHAIKNLYLFRSVYTC